MKKIVNILLLIILLFAIAGCIIPSFLPKNINFQVSREYNNPISEVFLEFNDLENYGVWGTMVSEDSINTRINYFAPYKGEGSSLTWSNKKDTNIGKGEYKILKSKINKYIQSQIIFVETAVICIEDIYFKPVDGSTQVTVNLKTEDFSYFNRIFAYLYAERLQDNLEESLARLEKKLSKGNLNKILASGDTEYTDLQGIQMIAIKNETSTDAEDIYKSMHKSLGEITEYLTDSLRYIPNDIKNPIAYYIKYDTIEKSAVFYSGYPVKLDILPPNTDIKLISIPGGKAIYTPISGKVENLINARYTLDTYSKENGVKLKNQFWEEYLDFPLSFDDEIKGNAYYLIIE
ncbi:hypothetical protein O2K51_09160 [Apibacter raozihei]|uniref:hypothetical protein n=1 Tax=Apibacter TaxID=1778601 RepID=UPI000FE399D6|nr:MULTISPECIES: hypothetical protein [Apibacter]